MKTLYRGAHARVSQLRTVVDGMHRGRLGAAPVTTQSCSATPITLSDNINALKGRFMVPAAEVQQLLEASGKTHEELLFSLITPASKLARPPISGYYVG